MRFCIARRSGPRGSGLGNELFTWSKAFLASEVLGAKLLHPAFGLNPRLYHRDFGTSRFDWLAQRLLTTSLPVVEFHEDAYRATGKDDFEEAVAEFADREGLLKRRSYIFAVSGMWGGFLAIRKARTFVMAELLKSRSSVSNIYSTLRNVDPEKLLVAVHIRRGDFTPVSDEADYRGRFNVALPLDWYLETCASLEKALPGRVQFLLLTDASTGVKPFTDRFDALTTSHLRLTTSSDLLLMGMADSIVCSVSSFSMWGAFLSDAPYFWFAPNLQTHGEYSSLWGNEPREQNGGVTDLNLRSVLDDTKDGSKISRGVPIGIDGKIPGWAADVLDNRLRTRALSRDLIYSGVAPVPASANQPISDR